jgi:hypothetical protein
MRLLPVFADRGAFTYLTSLGGVSYRLEFYWKPKLQFWYMDIFDGVTDAPIILGRKIVHSSFPLNQKGFDIRPGAALLFVGTDYSRQEDLGVKIEVYALD